MLFNDSSQMQHSLRDQSQMDKSLLLDKGQNEGDFP
jgi:hypothetical protein